MSYESTAEPIRVGYLFDLKLPSDFPQPKRDELMRPFELVFNDALAQGIIDRPVQMLFREVNGLPLGSVKAVIDAYGELVDEGCLVIFGPSTTDNAVPTREAIEERYKVPAVSVTGTDDWLGEWTFSFPMGSLTDEPIFWAGLLAKAAHTQVGVLVEQSLIGESYLKNSGIPPESKGFASPPRPRSRKPPKTSPQPFVTSTMPRPKQSCTADSDLGSSASIPHWPR